MIREGLQNNNPASWNNHTEERLASIPTSLIHRENFVNVGAAKESWEFKVQLDGIMACSSYAEILSYGFIRERKRA